MTIKLTFVSGVTEVHSSFVPEVPCCSSHLSSNSFFITTDLNVHFSPMPDSCVPFRCTPKFRVQYWLQSRPQPRTSPYTRRRTLASIQGAPLPLQSSFSEMSCLALPACFLEFSFPAYHILMAPRINNWANHTKLKAGFLGPLANSNKQSKR